MNTTDLLNEARKIVKAHPNLGSEVIELYELAIDEIAEGGSEEHECELALQAIKELINETN